MMQSRRQEHGSSGELDVFGATSYFAGLPPPPAPDDDCRRPSSAATELSYFQAKAVAQRDTTRMATEGNSFRGPHQQQQLAGLRGHAERHATNKQQLMQVVAAKRQLPSSAKSKLAALLSFMVSPSAPSPRASFRKEEKKQEAPSSTRLLRQSEAAASAAAGGELETANNTYKPANSRSSSSSRESSGGMQLQGLFGAHDDDDELDLGVATGDRRLQGITVVKGIGGDEDRWVVRCMPGLAGGAWDEEEHRETKMLDVDASAGSASSEQNIKDELMVEVEQQRHEDDDGNIDTAHSWDSDSSSDLFDLDLEYR